MTAPQQTPTHVTERPERDPSAFAGPVPQHGDRVRVVRTRTVVETFEGIWVDDTGTCDPEYRYCSSGHSMLLIAEGDLAGGSMRLRDRGPIAGSCRPLTSDAEVVESDLIEVVETRHGAPYRDLAAQWQTEAAQRRDDEYRHNTLAARRRRRERSWWYRLGRHLRPSRQAAPTTEGGPR